MTRWRCVWCLSKESTGEPFEAVDPYLVGIYLTKYGTSGDGHANWSAPSVSLNPGMYEVEYYEQYDEHLDYLVRQDITLELTYNNAQRSSQPLLVGVEPSFRITDTPEKFEEIHIQVSYSSTRGLGQHVSIK